MKTQLWFLFFFASSFLCFSKKEKTASFYFVPPEGDQGFYYSWTLNGKTVDEHNRCSLPIHYPNADTIILTRGNYTRTIITSLKNRHVYELSEGSWQNDVSIRDMTERMRHSPQQQANTYPLRVVFHFHNNLQDTLLAGSFGMTRRNHTHGKIAEGNKLLEIEESEWADEPGHPYDICIGTGSVRTEANTYSDSRFLKFDVNEKDVFVFDETLLAFEYKFFDKTTLIIDYDCKNRTYKFALKH